MEVYFLNKSFVMVLALFSYCARVQSQTVDLIQMIRQFPRPSAVLSTTAKNGEDNLECLRAVLTQYQPDEGNAAYVWLFRQDTGGERPVVMSITKGDSPEEVNIISSDASEGVRSMCAQMWGQDTGGPVQDPTHSFPCIAHYTDYESCFVLEQQAVENLCMLWVSDEYRNNVPEECTRKYNEYCGEGVSIYDQDICEKERTN